MQTKQQSVRGTGAELGASVGRQQTSKSPPVILLLAVPRRFFCFGFMLFLDVAYCYVLLFLLDIKLENR